MSIWTKFTFKWGIFGKKTHNYIKEFCCMGTFGFFNCNHWLCFEWAFLTRKQLIHSTWCTSWSGPSCDPEVRARVFQLTFGFTGSASRLFHSEILSKLKPSTSQVGMVSTISSYGSAENMPLEPFLGEKEKEGIKLFLRLLYECLHGICSLFIELVFLIVSIRLTCLFSIPLFWNSVCFISKRRRYSK